ncbi:MAG: bifunctional methylenetetrahydrofolate dehydrogenase/methenyltetrahydrofolate cyclohydrolase FolD [Proteobacteria bacterium]|nr:bifunctional methylenetetrahydrofolate dehydrogenase/methenyltetrahydrofolate cyclohydrolase FolD [Pseudomonadota bacterium]
MPEARILDGKAAAAALRLQIAAEAARLKARHGIVPGIAMVLVGDDPASQVYVRSKTRAAGEAGFHVRDIVLAADAPEADVLAQVAALNADPQVHGFLVQLPLPPQVDPERVIDAIDPAKDADGFHVVNAGRLAMGRDGVVPATPLGCMHLIRRARAELAGLEAVVIGRSNTVGKPMAQLLLREHCTVTIAHSRTRGLADIARRADVLVAAVGRPEIVRGDWIKPGATVIDVGINRLPPETPGEKGRLVGDVAFAEAVAVAGAITPVPGGVGPMTIACLLQNTLLLARRSAGAAA